MYKDNDPIQGDSRTCEKCDRKEMAWTKSWDGGVKWVKARKYR